jgi:hypothetical protein
MPQFLRSSENVQPTNLPASSAKPGDPSSSTKQKAAIARTTPTAQSGNSTSQTSSTYHRLYLDDNNPYLGFTPSRGVPMSVVGAGLVTTSLALGLGATVMVANQPDNKTDDAVSDLKLDQTESTVTKPNMAVPEQMPKTAFSQPSKKLAASASNPALENALASAATAEMAMPEILPPITISPPPEMMDNPAIAAPAPAPKPAPVATVAEPVETSMPAAPRPLPAQGSILPESNQPIAPLASPAATPIGNSDTVDSEPSGVTQPSLEPVSPAVQSPNQVLPASDLPASVAQPPSAATIPVGTTSGSPAAIIAAPETLPPQRSNAETVLSPTVAPIPAPLPSNPSEPVGSGTGSEPDPAIAPADMLMIQAPAKPTQSVSQPLSSPPEKSSAASLSAAIQPATPALSHLLESSSIRDFKVLAMPLTRQEAQDIRQLNQSVILGAQGQFTIVRLAPSAYQAMWWQAYREETSAVPEHGFVDYRQRMIAIPQA